MVGNTGNLMSMRIVRNKVRSQDDTIVSTAFKNTSNTTTTTTTDNNDLEQQQEQQQQQKPHSSFNRGHKHLSISFRLPKNQHNNFNEDTTTTTTAGSIIAGRSRFFAHHFSYHQNNNKSSTTTTTTANDDNQKVVAFTRTSGIGGMPTNTWVFPPNAPTPNIYHCLNTEELMAANDNGGFKGFRKQFSGRFKRLVAAKKPEPTPVIPPHLKAQLKTIYVY